MVRFGSSAIAVLCACACAGLLMGCCCRAQQQQQKPVFTLKLQENLLQVPTLVLDHNHRPMGRIDPSRFRVSVDHGKKFSPSHVRMEGEDPLDLTILLDMSGSQRDLIRGFAEALAKMAADSLHPQDRVSIYALNCHLIRSSLRLFPRPDLLSKSVETALSTPALNEGYRHGVCPQQASVWDAMMIVAQDMGESRARRAMLVVSEGEVQGTASFADLHHYAGVEGIALFGLNDGFAYSYDPYRRDRGDLFRDLCESTGGLVIYTDHKDLEKQLEQWVAMLRGRYVVEFPQPQRLVAGLHDIRVSITDDYMAFVSLAGVSMALPNPSLTSDPHYLPSTAGADIPVGSQRSVKR